MSVVSLKAARVDKRFEELLACDNIKEIHVMYRLPCGAAIVCVVPYPSEGGSGEDWGQPNQPFPLHIDPDLEGTGVRPELFIQYRDREPQKS